MSISGLRMPIDRATSPAAAALMLQVKEIRLEAEGVISLVLVQPSGEPLPAWTPGAHLEIVLPSGLARQYSLCSAPEDQHTYRVSVLREEQGRGGSLEIHDTALIGKVLEIRGPRNHFQLRPSSKYVFIAGGIGVTPILPMIRSQRSSSEWEIYYAGRSLSTMAFVEELRTVDDQRVHLFPRDQGSRLNIDQLAAAIDSDTAVYCCGPARLLEAVKEVLDRIAPDTKLYTEKFVSGGSGTSKPAPEGTEREFDVELRRTGVTLRVPTDRSILDVVRDVVPGAPSSCEEGYCGSCETRILAGVADHRDEILTDDERRGNTAMFTCVSRAVSDKLVLDL